MIDSRDLNKVATDAATSTDQNRCCIFCNRIERWTQFPDLLQKYNNICRSVFCHKINFSAVYQQLR